MAETPTSSVLDQFRQAWRQEVNARNQEKQHKPSNVKHARTKSQTEHRAKPERLIARPPGQHPLAEAKDEDTSAPESSAQEAPLERLEDTSIRNIDDDEFSTLYHGEPKTALEHFERAVEKEDQGKLSDSLTHYRKAYRLDAKVDQEYKDKHYAHRWKQTNANTNPSNAAPTVPSTAHHSQSEAGGEPVPRTTDQLIASFANCEIPNADPIIEGDVPPPCPIRKLPTEVLLELLQHIAARDVSIYVRMASVCKKLAYHVYTENAIWKQIALGNEFGLASQKYHFGTDIQGRPAIWQALKEDDEDEKPIPSITADLFSNEQDWRDVFHSYPRIRFTGVYISTVNYTRSGGASVTPSNWGSQVHIVTYYRYLRFFRDGTVISLLTTHEPIEVVHFLTRENIAYVRAGSSKQAVHPLNFTSAAPALLHHRDEKSAPPPTAQNILKHALRGRWRLCHPSLDSVEVASNAAAPGDLHIETEGGAGPRYMYTMHLSLKNGNARNKFATKNNKLIWKGFWSYNSLANDWAEFQLRHDKAFWFSRVKSYGLGY